MEGGGTWRSSTWKDYWDDANRLSAGFQAVGLSEGLKVGIMAHTSQTWELCQMAVLIAAGVVVGMDAHDREESIRGIAARSGLSGMIIDHPDQIEKIPIEVRERLAFIVSIEGAFPQSSPGLYRLEDVKRLGDVGMGAVSTIRARKDSPATIIFTSGTTGTPKGIEYTHEQVVTACSSILEVFGVIREGSSLVCWLPLSNLFQRMVNFCAISLGASTYFVEDPKEVVSRLAAINPHVFIAVPRFFEKLHQGIIESIRHQPLPARKLIQWAIHIGDRHARAIREQRGLDPLSRASYAIADQLVLKRLRGALGSNLQYMISGSAPMPRWLLEWFHAIGIVILEAYGISENVIPIAINRPQEFRFGTVGKPLSGNEVTIAEDGELLVKGRGLCRGYYEDDSGKTPLTADGSLATGDYAAVDGDGFITLTGRKSEIFKTSTGRRIAPVGIESCILRVPYVEHAVVLGAGRKSVIALISVSRSLLMGDSPRQADARSLSEEMCKKIKADVKRETASLPAYQRPAALLATFDPFTVQGGELTSNLKLRRKSIEQKHLQYIERLFEDVEASKESTDMMVRTL